MDLLMSAKERDRLQAVGQVRRGKLAQREGGELLGDRGAAAAAERGPA